MSAPASPLHADRPRKSSWKGVKDALRHALIAEREDQGRPTPYTRGLVAYVAACAGLAAVLIAVTVRAPDDWTAVLVVASVVFVMSRTAVRSVAGVDYGFTASMMLHIGGAITFGPACALVTALAESCGVALRGRTDRVKTLFNAANMTLSNLTAWGLFEVTGSPRSGWPLAATGIAAGVAYWIANHLPIFGVLGISRGGRVVQPFARSALGMVPYFAIYGFSATAFRPLHSSLGVLGVLVLVGPLLAAQLFLIVMEHHTRAHQMERSRHLQQIETQNRFLEEQNVRIERAHDATLVALTHALDARDKETEGHSRRVVEYTRAIGRAIGLDGDSMRAISHGALLHDIGKIGVPDAILHKPSGLNEEEWAIMRTHPAIGHAMVEDVDLLRDARRLILHHHERWDGTGYPRGLRGKEIDYGARIFAVADALDAITQDRPYRRAASLDVAREEIRRFRGVHFDPEAVDAFLTLEERELLAIVRLRSRPGLDLLIDTEARARYLASLGLGAQLTRA